MNTVTPSINVQLSAHARGAADNLDEVGGPGGALGRAQAGRDGGAEALGHGLAEALESVARDLRPAPHA